MGTITLIFQGLIAIPKLIEQIQTMVKKYEKWQYEKWRALSIQLERKLEKAKTKEELRNVAKEIQDLIRSS